MAGALWDCRGEYLSNPDLAFWKLKIDTAAMVIDANPKNKTLFLMLLYKLFIYFFIVRFGGTIYNYFLI
jgi:hypothetical protein